MLLLKSDSEINNEMLSNLKERRDLTLCDNMNKPGRQYAKYKNQAQKKKTPAISLVHGIK